MITEQVRALEGDKPIEPPIEDRLRALFQQRAEDFLVQAGEELRAPAGAGRGKAAALGQAAADCIRAASLLGRRGELSDALRLDAALAGDDGRDRLGRFLCVLNVSAEQIEHALAQVDQHVPAGPFDWSLPYASRILGASTR
jgi:hypothetical protein